MSGFSFNFGTPSTGQQQQQQQPQSSAPAFSFGTPAASTPQSTGGLFGAASKPSTPSLFGGGATGAAGNTPAAGGNAPFSFGAPSAAGGSTQTSQPQQSTSLFGTPQTNQQQQQQPPQQQTSSLFGGGGSTFGATTNTSQPQTSSSPFSFSQPAGASSTSNPFSFGQKPGNTQSAAPGGGFSFGSSLSQPQQQPQQQPSLFQSQAPQLGQSSLSQSILQPPAQDNLASKLAHIQGSWDASNPATCAFKTYVYNVMDPQTAQWIKTQNGGQPPRTAQDVDEQLWVKAQKENPDTDKFLPSLLVGHEALAERVKLQEDMADKHATKLEEFSGQLRTLNSKHTLETSLRLQRARHAQAVLSARLIHLVARLHQMTPIRGSPMRAEEEALHTALEQCVRAMGGRGEERGSTMQDRVNELWVLIAQKKARRVGGLEGSNGSSGNNGSGGQSAADWAVANESEAIKVLQVLVQQQRTLDYLTDVVKNDAAVLDVVKQGFGEAPVSGSLGHAQ